MSNHTPDSFLPEKCRILSGSALKMIAMLTMLIDHTGMAILSQFPEAQIPLFSFLGNPVSLYRLSRDIGRVAFPIFCFLLAEGFLHTKNRFRYGRNLLLFAILSELPWNYIHTNTFFYEKQNVFFTLFIGYLGFCAIEYFREKQTLQFFSVLGLFSVSFFFQADYGWKGFIFLLIMYTLHRERTVQAIIGSCWLAYEWKACFAFLSINMYNGKRGFIKGKGAKYFFYAFYPLHLTLLIFIRQYLL